MTTEEIEEIKEFQTMVATVDLICACAPTEKIASELIALAASWEERKS